MGAQGARTLGKPTNGACAGTYSLKQGLEFRGQWTCTVPAQLKLLRAEAICQTPI